MIEIRPTTTSALSHATYAVKLPGEINPIRARAQKISIALDGSAIISAKPRNNTGAQQTVQLTITMAQYATLKLIVNHATVTEWVVTSEGRWYVCVIDIDTPVSVTVKGIEYKRLSVSFTVVEVGA